ncbi:MAG: copper amine oxidase [Candidatus Limnocylindria bacterium]
MRKLRTLIATIGAAAVIAISGTGVLAAPAELSSPAADLRVALNRLLSEHASLAMEAMREGVDTGDLSDPEFTAVAGALAGNTDDLTAAIESVYGTDAGDAFRAQWEAHIGFFVDYTVGVATDDDAAKQSALDDLAGYREDFAGFLDAATEGGLPADAAADALAMHVDQLISQIDLYAAGDYAGAYAAAREAYAHMGMTADALALAIIQQDPDTFSGNSLAWSPAVDLQIALDLLLSEHAIVAIEAMRNGFSGAADFEASANALAANTDDLTAAIESVYGADAGAAFRTQWEAHIGFFVDYTVALAGDNEAGQQAALDELAGYREDFAAFLDGATDGNAPAGPVSDALQAHVDQLIGALNAFAEGDFEGAYAAEREASAHMFMTGQVLAAAIAGQFPDRFPTTPMPSDTAMARPEPGTSPAVLIGLALASVAAVSLTRRAIEVRSHG